MTCIAGLVCDGKVWIGCDSLVSNTWEQTVRKESKVFKVGDFLIGVCGSCRVTQLVQYAFTPPRLPANADDLSRYMVTEFVDALRNTLKTGGVAEKRNEAEVGGTCLVGIHGRLFEIEADYQVGEAACGYSAIGSGGPVARGSLFSTKGNDPKDRIQLALRSAEEHAVGVRGPFNVLTVD